jgi:hypothetical protein
LTVLVAEALLLAEALPCVAICVSFCHIVDLALAAAAQSVAAMTPQR